MGAQSGQMPRRGSSVPSAPLTTPIPPDDYPELAKLRRDVDVERLLERLHAEETQHEEAIQGLRAELRALTAVEKELRERTIERGVRIAELEGVLAKKDRRIAELEEAVRRERAQKGALAEAVAHLQRVLAERSKSES
jgi:septal ring factor EnvC (AmiA/AmiB activator)